MKVERRRETNNRNNPINPCCRTDKDDYDAEFSYVDVVDLAPCSFPFFPHSLGSKFMTTSPYPRFRVMMIKLIVSGNTLPRGQPLRELHLR